MNTPSKIKLSKLSTFRDGGTKSYKGSDGNVYYIDGRINSTTKGEIFNEYPKENSTPLDKNNFVF